MCKVNQPKEPKMNKKEHEEHEERRKLEQQRFAAFVKELTELSKKHGIVIKSTGGIYISNDPKEVEGLVYTDDASSCDLYYNLTETQEA
jgi:hypothetical protein